jgi:hypothetical protein
MDCVDDLHVQDKLNQANEPNQANHANPNEDLEDVMEESFDSDDDASNIDLSDIFPNTDDNPIEYVYTRDKSGRVVTVDCRFKVPKHVPQDEELLNNIDRLVDSDVESNKTDMTDATSTTEASGRKNVK